MEASVLARWAGRKGTVGAPPSARLGRRRASYGVLSLNVPAAFFVKGELNTLSQQRPDSC
jgi:hypothetical protein